MTSLPFFSLSRTVVAVVQALAASEVGDVNVKLWGYDTITPAAKKVIYQPEARASDPVRFPRWRVGLICSSMRNFLAGVICSMACAEGQAAKQHDLGADPESEAEGTAGCCASFLSESSPKR